jgi:hypothetical protein
VLLGEIGPAELAREPGPMQMLPRQH